MLELSMKIACFSVLESKKIGHKPGQLVPFTKNPKTAFFYR